MPLNSAMGDIAHVIQLAIAPVFLLTAVGTLLNVLVNRLGRSVDRRRTLVATLPKLDAALAANAQGELEYVHRRVRLIYTAILLAVVAAISLYSAVDSISGASSISSGSLQGNRAHRLSQSHNFSRHRWGLSRKRQVSDA